MKLGAGFDDFDVEVEQDVTIHGTQAGSGPALLLLHGFPQNLLMWHAIASDLAKTYTVVALDLRGYGQSSKPRGDEKHAVYSKSSMALDCTRVMKHLGHDRFFVCAHDRGARVAHKLLVDHPKLVKKAVILDICPTLAMYNATDQLFATAYYHWFFLIQPSPFPEDVILAAPATFGRKQLGGMHAPLSVFHPDALDSYMTQLADAQGVHAMCEDYRAAATIDLEEAGEDIDKGRKIQCPIKVLWGKYGLIEKCFDAVKEWQKVSAADVQGDVVDCGHYIPEEKPEVVLQTVKEFLVD